MQVNSEPITRQDPTRPAVPAPGGAAVVGHQLSAGDAEKAAALRKMKLVALGLLIAMAIVFVFAFALQREYPWLHDY